MKAIKSMFAMPGLRPDDIAIAFLILIIYIVGMVYILDGLYEIIKYPFQWQLGSYAYIFIVWYVSMIVNLAILSCFPGMTYLDKGTQTTKRLYFIAGPLLYPKVFCLWLYLSTEMSSFTTALALLRKPSHSWGDLLIHGSRRFIKFASLIEKHREYLRE